MGDGGVGSDWFDDGGEMGDDDDDVDDDAEGDDDDGENACSFSSSNINGMISSSFPGVRLARSLDIYCVSIRNS